MPGGPELFVVCKSCGEQVSPYITECPYCGNRLRKRAPKLEKGGTPKAPRGAKRAKPPREPRLGRLRAGEIPGVRADGRPWVTGVLVLVAIVVTIGTKAGWPDVFDLVVGLGPDDWWRAVTTLFVFGGTGYELVTLGAIFLFGWLLERRHGHWAPLLVFLVGGAGAMALVMLLDPGSFAAGANGAALALLAAWAVRDLLGRRRGEETEGDLLGVTVIAFVLILVPLAAEEAHPLAGAFGGMIGLLLGLVLARMPER